MTAQLVTDACRWPSGAWQPDALLHHSDRAVIRSPVWHNVELGDGGVGFPPQKCCAFRYHENADMAVSGERQ